MTFTFFPRTFGVSSTHQYRLYPQVSQALFGEIWVLSTQNVAFG